MNETMKTTNIIETWEQGKNHLSSTLLQQLHFDLTVPEVNQYEVIAGYIKLVELISKLGWVEHTSDWDLNMIIETKDGQHLESGHGYGDCVQLMHKDTDLMLDAEYFPPSETLEFELRHTSDAEYEGENPSWSVNIHNIKTIFMDK